MNPFVELWANPVTTLAALAYALLLLSITVALAGVMWSTSLHVAKAWENRHRTDHFGPEWAYVPPVAVFGRVAGLLFLGALEALLIGGIVYVIS